MCTYVLKVIISINLCNFSIYKLILDHLMFIFMLCNYAKKHDIYNSNHSFVLKDHLLLSQLFFASIHIICKCTMTHVKRVNLWFWVKWPQTFMNFTMKKTQRDKGQFIVHDSHQLVLFVEAVIFCVCVWGAFNVNIISIGIIKIYAI